MNFLNDFGITSTVGLFGLALLALGGFMVLAGTGIVSIQQITVKQGRATWVVGLGMAILGLFFLFPEVSGSEEIPQTVVVVEVTPTALAEANDVVLVEPTAEIIEAATPTTIPATVVPNEPSVDGWASLQFNLPADGLWTEEDGRYTATGSDNTFIWSDEIFEGNIEISFDIESTSSFSASNVILFGDGENFATGNLIFTIASDQQVILANSVFEGGIQLDASLSELSFGEEKHTVLISVINRKASLFLDGDEILSATLKDNINTSGQIGLWKYWDVSDITYSNLQVRTSGFDQ